MLSDAQLQAAGESWNLTTEPIVFVVDSNPARLQENLDAFQDLKRNLVVCRSGMERIPVIFQYNKRDLPEVLPVGTVEERVGFAPQAVFEAVASKGDGVKPTAQAISRSVVQRFSF